MVDTKTSRADMAPIKPTPIFQLKPSGAINGSTARPIQPPNELRMRSAAAASSSVVSTSAVSDAVEGSLTIGGAGPGPGRMPDGGEITGAWGEAAGVCG